MRTSKYNSTQRILLGLMVIVAIIIVGFGAIIIIRAMSVKNEVTHTPTPERMA